MAVVIIEIDDNDIKRGMADPNRRVKDCPVYFGAKKVIKNLSHVATTALVLEGGEDGTTRLDLPPKVRNFIARADYQCAVARGTVRADPNNVNSEPLRPFSFPFHIPDELYQPM